MKKIPVLFATALFALLSFSCSSDNGDDHAEQGQVISEQVYHYRTQNPYTGSGKVYMGDKKDGNGKFILTEENMLLVGTVNNGKITINLPKSVDSRFMEKIESVPAGMNVNFEPFGVEMWFYTESLRLIDNNGNYIGDIDYMKIDIDSNKIYNVSYMYFSEAMKINGLREEENETIEYEIDAKKGWNKIYWEVSVDTNTRFVSAFLTTDLSDVPDGLMWLF
jgi:hypothetical protein